jgi:hypothetical protein
MVSVGYEPTIEIQKPYILDLKATSFGNVNRLHREIVIIINIITYLPN